MNLNADWFNFSCPGKRSFSCANKVMGIKGGRAKGDFSVTFGVYISGIMIQWLNPQCHCLSQHRSQSPIYTVIHALFQSWLAHQDALIYLHTASHTGVKTIGTFGCCFGGTAHCLVE